MQFGISDIQIFFPNSYLSFKTLVAERAKTDPIWREKLEKALKITGQKSLRFPYKDQDSVVLGVEALYKLLQANPRDFESLRVFLGGTETGVDHSKSITSYIGEALESADIHLPHSHASFQIQHACAGGMYGVLSGLAHLQTGSRKPDGEWGIMVATDISRYEAPSTAEVTQGAGAAALLLEENPKLLRVDLTTVGYSSQGVDDFFRPLGSLTAKVKGRYSVECFNSALREAFLNFCARKDDYPEAVLATTSMVIVHTPYAHMPASAMKPLLKEFYSQDEAEIEAYLDSRYIHKSTRIAAEVGNLYTAGLFVSLACGLREMHSQIGSEIVGKRILVASYGSGNTMIVTEMVVTPTAAGIIETWNLDQLLNTKREASWEEYLAWLEQSGSTLVESEEEGFFLKEVREDGYRLYGRKTR